MKDKYRQALSKIIHDTAVFELLLHNMERKDKVLTYNSTLYLDIVNGKNGYYTASNIADLLHVARPSVTQKINELESAGYITKIQSEKDRRVYYLSVTEKYGDIFNSCFGEGVDVDSEIISLLTSKYSESEVDKFFEMIDMYNNHFIEGFVKCKKSDNV